MDAMGEPLEDMIDSPRRGKRRQVEGAPVTTHVTRHLQNQHAIKLTTTPKDCAADF